MRRCELAALCWLLLLCLPAAAADRRDELARWQGTWKLVSCTANGESQQANVQWIVSGNRYHIRLDGKTGTDPYTITLDARQKRIDVFHHETPQGTWGGKLKGIYQLQGDSLKVCYDLKGERYPQSIAAGPGSGQVVYVFERVR